MLNKEKYAKEILDIICNGNDVGKQKGHLYPCANMPCYTCEFNTGNVHCNEEFIKWANSEYKEREIDWNKVPIDTPIYVWDDNYSKAEKFPRYFAKYRENNTIGAFDDGRTSWSGDGQICYWEHAEVKEGIDCSKWYKD